MEPLRPVPRPTPFGRLHATVAWVRLPRLVAMAASVLIVAAGSWWLLRSPAPPIEQSLPFATSTAGTVQPGTPRAVTTEAGGRISTTQPQSSPRGGEPASSTATAQSKPTSEPAAIIVQAAGAVVRPGVFTMPAGSRVNDLLAAAGGPTTDAAAQSVNLAAPLMDGQRIYVPRIGEPTSTTSLTPLLVPTTPSSAGATGPIDINHADVATIDQLPGIGPSTAAAIIAYRQANGPFASADDLLKVRGVGPAKLAVIRALVTT